MKEMEFCTHDIKESIENYSLEIITLEIRKMVWLKAIHELM